MRVASASPHIQASLQNNQAKIYKVSLKSRIKSGCTRIIGISQTETLIIKEIAEYYSETNPFNCYLSIRSLAKNVKDKQLRWVGKCLKRLEDKAMLIRIPTFQPIGRFKGQTSNSYALTPYLISLALNKDDHTQALAQTRQAQKLSKERSFLVDDDHQLITSFVEGGKPESIENTQYYLSLLNTAQHPPPVLQDTQTINSSSKIDIYNIIDTRQNLPSELSLSIENINAAKEILSVYAKSMGKPAGQRCRDKFIKKFIEGGHDKDELLENARILATDEHLRTTTTSPNRLFHFKRTVIPLKGHLFKRARRVFGSYSNIETAIDSLVTDKRYQNWFKPLLKDEDKSLRLLSEMCY